jgi:hypothetical protein
VYARTASSITLRQAGARELVIERAEIATMAVAPQSTMPSDLATVISPEEMAHLLAFLRR